MKRFKFLSYMFIAAWLVKSIRPSKAGRQSADIAGETADSPADLSKAGWKKALLKTKAALKDKNLQMSAAGLAYYATLSFFPVMLGSAALYASLTNPQALGQAINGLKDILPAAIYTLIHTQLSPLTTASKGSTVFATIISLLALLWTTSGGLQNLVKTTNIAYEVEESRGFVKLRLVSLALSVALLVFGGIILSLLLLQGTALASWGLPHVLAVSFSYIRWPLLILMITIALAAIYRYAPNRPEPHLQWVSWGAAAATILWAIVTALFFVYVQNFANFNKTYGIFAGLVVLMTWFNFSALIVLLGAQVNKKLEEVTAAPTQS